MDVFETPAEMGGKEHLRVVFFFTVRHTYFNARLLFCWTKFPLRACRKERHNLGDLNVICLSHPSTPVRCVAASLARKCNIGHNSFHCSWLAVTLCGLLTSLLTFYNSHISLKIEQTDSFHVNSTASMLISLAAATVFDSKELPSPLCLGPSSMKTFFYPMKHYNQLKRCVAGMNEDFNLKAALGAKTLRCESEVS